MKTTVITKRTKIHKVSIKNEGVPLREDIPVIETHTVKLLFDEKDPGTPDAHFSLNGIHSARFTNGQIAFIDHMINEVGLERWEEECLDLLHTIEKG